MGKLLVRYIADSSKGNDLPAIATGMTDDQGHYKLQYEYRGQEGPGASVGWHRVTVIDTLSAANPRRPVPSRVPANYIDPAKTPLEVEVKASTEPQTIDLEVK